MDVSRNEQLLFVCLLADIYFDMGNASEQPLSLPISLKRGTGHKLTQVATKSITPAGYH